MSSEHEAMAQFWPTVHPQHRHIVEAMSPEKQERLKNRFWDNFLDILPDDYIPQVAWDWGCGGGLLSSMLVEYAMDVLLLDVSRDSLDHAAERISLACLGKVLLDDLQKDWARYPKPEVLICYNVVHHFPSLAYFQQVVEIWKQVDPEWIGLTAKTGTRDVVTEAANYQQDYVHGLVLPYYEVEKLLRPEYQLMHYGPTKTQQGEPLGHLTFRKKNP